LDLSPIQKLLLINQYEILKRIDSSAERDSELMLECLYRGYDDDFAQLMPQFDKKLDSEVRQEVRDILQMFRALQRSYDEKPAAVFVGFDGNDESEYYSYAQFVIEDMGLWRESKREDHDYNTHAAILEDYRAMVREWKASNNELQLTNADIERIVSAAPHLSTAKRRQEEA
jgi:uncharacterized protein